jgi:CHAT domain-containing protein
MPRAACDPARAEVPAPVTVPLSPITREGFVRSLGSAATERRRRVLLAAVPHAEDSTLARRLQEAALSAAQADLARADRLSRAAMMVADRLGDATLRARSLRTRGHVLSLRGLHKRALQEYRSALALLASADDRRERAVTLSGALQTLIYAGEYQAAHAMAEEARGIFEAAGDTVRLGRLETNVGNIFYRQDRFAEALACYLRAHAILAESGDARDVGVVLRNITVCWISLNDFPAALDAYRTARAWSERHAMPRLTAENDYNVAYLHYLRGEYASAIELYRATREHCRRVGDRYHAALCDLDQSEIYLELNLNEAGEHLATEAFRAFRRLRMPYEMGKALVNMGAAAARAGEPERALRSFADARHVFGREGNRHWLTITDLYRALVLSESGDEPAAGRLCRTALTYFRRCGPPGKEALCQLLLARLALRAGRAADARPLAELAVARAEAAEAAPLAAEGYLLLGDIHEALGEPEVAYAAVRQAHAGFETLRSQIAGEQLKIAFLVDKGAVYESLVALALEREPPILRSKVAFRYIEQAKSRSLADMMAFGPVVGARANAGPARAVAELRRELKSWYRKIEAHESATVDRHCSATASALRQRARACEARLVRAEAKLEHADAELRALGSGAALPLETIRSALPPATALVEYYDLRGQLVVAVLSADTLEIVRLGPTARVRTLLRLLQFQLSKFKLGDGYAARFASSLLAATRDHLCDLHCALIQPVLPALDGIRHLVVVPHGFLHYLPFHALFDGDSFLHQRVSVSYAPSATVYYLCRTRPQAPGASPLVLGVADPRAPHIVDEVQAVSDALPGASVFVGREATGARLREAGSARFVHLATHGLFRQDNPMFSAVRLGDGEMSLLDLYELRLSAELVTLSGCGTGLSAIVGGDELVGLVRGLLYAGARALLVTLWDVNDRSTAAFMGAFYRHLGAGMDKRAAMTAAVTRLRADWPHPYFWAPFALVGDASGEPYINGAGSTP